MSTISTSLPSSLRALQRPRGDLDRVAVGALLVDLRARLRADLHELLDRRRAVDVAGRHAPPTRSAPRAGSARAWPSRSSCRSPAAPPSGSPSAGSRARSSCSGGGRRPSAPSAPRRRSSRPAGRGSARRPPPRPGSAPSAAAVNCRTTLKLTSASSSARRISRIAASTSCSVSVPRLRTSASVPWSFSARESNIGARCSRRRPVRRGSRVGRARSQRGRGAVRSPAWRGACSWTRRVSASPIPPKAWANSRRHDEHLVARRLRPAGGASAGIRS